MSFIVKRNLDLNSNEKIIAFYKKELWSSHILEKSKKLKHYGTKAYRKTQKFDFPSARRYRRIRAIVSNAYRYNKKKFNTLSQLWKIL